MRSLIKYNFICTIFSSPEPLTHDELLWSLDARRVASVVNNCFKWHLLNYWLDFRRNGPYMAFSKSVQIVTVHCISRSQRLNIDFQDETFKTFFSNHKACSFDIWYVPPPGGPPPNLFKLSSWGQKWLRPGGHMFYIGLYRENIYKFFLSETFRPRALIFGM